MVPQQTNPPGEPPRTLSPDVEQQLEQSLRTFLTTKNASADDVRSALQRAAKDARARSLRAEELLTILKGLESRIGTVLPEDGGGDRDAGRSRLIRAMIEAYYLT
jgi:hypothetical protein